MRAGSSETGPVPEDGHTCPQLNMPCHGSPFAAAVGSLVSQFIPLLLGLVLGTLGGFQFLP